MKFIIKWFKGWSELKFIFKWDKGWFQALGLHHVIVSVVLICVGHKLGIGSETAGVALGWYASREWGLSSYPPRTFEFMDFISPALICISYWILI